MGIWIPSQALEPSSKMISLEDHSLDLGHSLKVNVADHHGPDESKSEDTCSDSQHAGLGVSVSLLDSNASGAANGVAELGVETLVDVLKVGHRGVGEESEEGIGVGVLPDDTGDGSTHSITDGTDDVEQTQHSGDVLVVNGSQDRKLLDDDEDTATDGDENLAEDEVTDGLVGATEVDHQTLGKDVQGHSDPKEPLEATGAADQVTNEEEQDTGDNVEDVADVSGLSDGEIVHDLQEGGEVVIPAVVAELVSSIQQTGTEDSAVPEEAELEQTSGSEFPLVDDEDKEQAEADHDHSNDVVSAPAVRGTAGDIEGQEEEDKTGGEEDETKDY